MLFNHPCTSVLHTDIQTQSQHLVYSHHTLDYIGFSTPGTSTEAERLRTTETQETSDTEQDEGKRLIAEQFEEQKRFIAEQFAEQKRFIAEQFEIKINSNPSINIS